MNLDSFGTCNKTENIVSEHWIAATSHLIVNTPDVLGVNYKNVISAFLLHHFLTTLLLEFCRIRLNGTLGNFNNHVLYVS